MTTAADLAHFAKQTADTVSLASDGFHIHVEAEMMMCSQPNFLTGYPRALESLHALIEGAPSTAFPMSYAKEKDGTVSISFGGLTPKARRIDAFMTTFESLSAVEDILPDAQKQGDTEAYVFGRNGNLNPDKRLLTAWARSPMEAVAKLYAHFSTDLKEDGKSVFQMNIHAEGDVEMRSLHDWSKHPIKEISARLMDELDIYLESQANKGDDMSMGFS